MKKHLTFIAVDKNSSASYTETFTLSNENEIDALRSEFETHVPFSKFYIEEEIN